MMGTFLMISSQMERMWQSGIETKDLPRAPKSSSLFKQSQKFECTLNGPIEIFGLELPWG
jgi:hypothetical protein